MHGVLAAHESREELGIGPGHGIEGLGWTSGRRELGCGDGVETPEAGGGIVHLRQRVERVIGNTCVTGSLDAASGANDAAARHGNR